MLRTTADYTVACICPMGVELAPVEAMLDEHHSAIPTSRSQNVYTLGKIGAHNVVIAVMPKIGSNIAAVVATQLLNDFPSIEFTLLVGIGGGIPGKVDIRLGDVVVSQGGIVQYDVGKRIEGGLFERTGSINRPPPVLGASIQKLDGQQRRLGNQLTVLLSDMLGRYPEMNPAYVFPTDIHDDLFVSSYPHRQPNNTCDECDRGQTVPRSTRADRAPRVHYGAIGSTNAVMKDAKIREELSVDTRVLCVEMEAAGLSDTFPCLVIRGICDYADSHKNKRWQPYAAAVAAVYMKALLLVVAPRQFVAFSPTVNIAQQSEYALGLNLFEAPELDLHQFVGRQDTLAEVQTILNPTGNSANRKVLVLGGIGGVGKTQLAIAYAKQHRNMYSSIFWLNATSEATLKSSFSLIAKRIQSIQALDLDENQIQITVLNWLSASANTKWLLIFDNYDEPTQYRLNHYYPYVSQGSILITSRMPDQVPGQPAHMTLRSLTSIDDSLEILSRRSGRDGTQDDQYARRLATRLDGLPLALATAGAFLNRNKSTWTFRQYLEIYEQRWHIDPRRPLQLSEYDKTLYTTWNLSYAQLAAQDSAAAQVLKLLAYFDHQAIWYELFHAGLEDDISVPQWLQDTCKDSANFDSVMRVLVDHCFLEIHTSTSQTSMSVYSMHTCVHDWVLAGLNSTVDTFSYWFALSCVVMSLQFEHLSDDYYAIELGQLRYASLVPHAARLTHNRFENMEQNVTEPLLNNMIGIAQLLRANGQLQAATTLLLQVLAGCERSLGSEHILTLDAVLIIGVLYEDQERLAEAESMCKRAGVSYGKICGAEHESTLMALGNLGRIYRKQRKLEAAERLYLQVLSGYQRLFGPDHQGTIAITNHLGGLYRDKKDPTTAEQMYTKALAGYEKMHGPEHTLTIQLVNNLGLIYVDQGRLGDAEQMFTRALSGHEKLLGPENKWTLDTAANLGHVYVLQGELLNGKRMLTRALAGFQRIYGKDHSSTQWVVKRLDFVDKHPRWSNVSKQKSQAEASKDDGESVPGQSNSLPPMASETNSASITLVDKPRSLPAPFNRGRRDRWKYRIRDKINRIV